MNIFYPLFISTISFNIIYYNTTYFKKNIVIKNKYILNKSNYNYYIFSDTNNNIYSTKNQWWKLKFNKAQNWNKIESNHEYIIYGYGITFKLLDIYPNIINIKKLNN